MKRSEQGGLVAVAVLGLLSCSRSTTPPPAVSAAPSNSSSEATMTWEAKPHDPCLQQYFDATLCESAVQNRGYHWGGVWIPTFYTRPYSNYISDHSSYVASGGIHAPAPAKVYDPGFQPPAAGTVVRGGYGKTASEAALSGALSERAAQHSARPPAAAPPAHHTPSSVHRKRPSQVKHSK